MIKDAKSNTETVPAGAGLRLKLTIAILAAFLIVIAVAFISFNYIANRITEDLGSAYAGRYALSNRALLQEPLTREIALVRQMAGSPLVREWARHEFNEHNRDQALAELESFRLQLAEHAWFYVVHSSLHYYYDDATNRYGETKLAYTLNPDVAGDAWYPATIANVPEYALNVNYDRALDTRKVWINAVVRERDGKPLGMVGTGFDLTAFLKQFVDHTEPGIENVIIDANMAVQAHRDRNLIDLQSVAKMDGERSTIKRVLPDPADVASLANVLLRLKSGVPVEVISVNIEGRKRMIGAAYLANLDWYILTMLNPDTVLRQHIFVPLFGLAVVLAVLAAMIVAMIVNRLILNPLAAITDAAACVSIKNYGPFDLPTGRSDEMGMLARTFGKMSDGIRDNTLLLESLVKDRTAELDKTNQSLQKNMKRLQDALANIKTLNELLPICAWCKKIRDDKGYWNQIEQYIKQHTGTEFTHGICPDCEKKLAAMNRTDKDSNAAAAD